jgi:hypothetical protein
VPKVPTFTVGPHQRASRAFDNHQSSHKHVLRSIGS